MEKLIIQRNLNENNRKGNLDVLKVISMIFIMFFHFGVQWIVYIPDFNPFFYKVEQCTEIIGRIGLGCFVLITCYLFMDINFKCKRFFVIWFELLFYSLVMLLFVTLYQKKLLTFKEIFTYFFPISSPLQYFPAYYLLFIIYQPLLKVACERFKPKVSLIIGLFILFISTLKDCLLIFWFNGNAINISTLLMFVSYYQILYFFKKRYVKLINNKIFLAISFLILFVFYVFVIGNFWDVNNTIIKCLQTTLSCESLGGFLLSFLFFQFFLNMNIKSNKFLFILSKPTLAILIMHTNVRFTLQYEIFLPHKAFMEKNLSQLLAAQLSAVLSVYLLYCLIDWIRILLLLEKPIFKISLLNRIFIKIDSIYKIT